MTTFSTSNLLNPAQYGFREGRSCLYALLDVYDNMLLTLSEGAGCVYMIYFDYAKAFDKADHGLFCHKLG